MAAELFCVSVRGPDDVIATRDYPEAVALAQLLNAGFAAHVAKAHHEYDPLMWAIPSVYLHGQESHAANLARKGTEYDQAVDHIRSVAA